MPPCTVSVDSTSAASAAPAAILRTRTITSSTPVRSESRTQHQTFA